MLGRRQDLVRISRLEGCDEDGELTVFLRIIVSLEHIQASFRPPRWGSVSTVRIVSCEVWLDQREPHLCNGHDVRFLDSYEAGGEIVEDHLGVCHNEFIHARAVLCAH